MIDVVVTTISDGQFLRAWGELIRKTERTDDVRLVVIPDLNTDDTLYERVKSLRKAGINVACPTTQEQAVFLAKLGCPEGFIPWRSDNRRNVGYLMSWRDGADMVISVDDDNLPLDETFFDEHEVVTGVLGSENGVSPDSGWYNPCETLKTRPEIIWPRGFPYFARHQAGAAQTRELTLVRINAGLWLGDPDVDAITRIGARPEAISFEGPSQVLAWGTWMPVNSQNTAIHRDVIPAYWFARMGMGGRYGDILSGYFAQACAKHLGDSVRVGTPLVRQDRNQHDLFRDLDMEWPWIKLGERLLNKLPVTALEGSTYRDAYDSLSHALDDMAQSLEAGVLYEVAYDMRQWLKLCDQIGRQ